MVTRQRPNEDLGTLTGDASRQTISVWDAICEGPIEGLVDGNGSVFLNNDPIVEPGGRNTVSKEWIGKIPNEATLTLNSNVVKFSRPYTSMAEIKKWFNTNAHGLIANKAVTLTGVTIVAGDKEAQCAGTFAVYSPTHNAFPRLQPIIRIANGNHDGTEWIGKIARIPLDADQDISNVTQFILWEFPPKSITNTTATIDVFAGLVGSYKTSAPFDEVYLNTLVSGGGKWPYPTITTQVRLNSKQVTVTPADYATGPTGSNGGIKEETVDEFGFARKYPRSSVQFRTGWAQQEPIKEIGSLQGNGVFRTVSLNRVMELVGGYYQDYPQYPKADNNNKTSFDHTEGSDSAYTIDSVGDLGLTNSNEVDELVLNFQYTSLFNQHNKKLDQYESYSAFEVEFGYTRDGGASYVFELLPYIEHSGKAIQAFSVDDRINLEPFQPFDKFKIRISRVTASSGRGYSPTSWRGKPKTMYQSNGQRSLSGEDYNQRVNAKCKLQGVTSIVKYKLSYPYTAYAAITFDSKSFQKVPTRSYHIRGKLIQVPSNYVTREENYEYVTANEDDQPAIYTRNGSGAITNAYVDWDGTFRTAYSNNPAWCLYDLLYSKRYGLGRFVEDVDKWSFYRVARYCDELVPDGKGGTEPRYTCNLVLQKETAARKVIQDLATNFIGLLHFLDGQMTLTSDKPSAPVYAFGKGNVIEGSFNYSTTEFKRRPNQYVVIYNNPEVDYEQDYVLVEDTANILETGSIITANTFAFGCTVRGQAERFGRWKLFTSKNQTEQISFGTSINASFLNPGDIITVQDGQRQQVDLSGRIPGTGGTLSTTAIPIDRPIVIQSGFQYELNVMFFIPAAVLVDATATINSVAYVQGDMIVTDNDGNALTYITVNNLTDEADSNSHVNVEWKPDNHVQTKPVSTSAGTVSALTVSSAFTAVPNRNTMWSITSKKGGIRQGASSKEFMVYSIRQNEGLEWEISGVEHVESKYAAIESNFTLVVEDEDFKGSLSIDSIPSISNLVLTVE